MLGSLDHRSKLRLSLSLSVVILEHSFALEACLQEPQESTICTEMRHGKLRLIDDRPALIVSSTSWTPDEDFRLLLDAAVEYDRQVRILTACRSAVQLLHNDSYKDVCV